MKTVLVVDDSSTIVKSMALMLKRAGYLSQTACGGDGALEKIAEQRPDFVFTDLNMPGMSGIELIREIRSMAHMQDVPLVLLTTETDPKIQKRAKAAGATGWIVKPMDQETLTSTLKRLLPAE